MNKKQKIFRYYQLYLMITIQTDSHLLLKIYNKPKLY